MPFELNQQVVLKGQNSTVGIIVEGPKIQRGQLWYRVLWSGEAKWTKEENLEKFEGQKTIIDFLKTNVYAGNHQFIQKITLTKLKQPQKNTIYSFNASRTELHGYQYKPLLKYLASPSKRILIADEVGLGKTIEAAYIFQEERVRHNIDRVLIVCPSQLRVKWQNEMWERFGERFDILNSNKCMSAIPKDPEKSLNHSFLGIASYNSLRGDNLIERVNEFPAALDLLIVDEVHHCRNRETKNFRIIEALIESTSAVVFLSATPVHTGNKNLYNIMNLLLPEKFDVEEAFRHQLEINSHIVKAEKYLLIATEESIKKAQNELSLLRNSPVVIDPFYDIISKRLEDERITTDRPFLVETQEMLSGLNIFNEVLNRTRKRDVQEKAPVRNANSISVKFTEYEDYVYQLLIGHIYNQYKRYYNDQVASFVLSNIARCIASSLVAAVQKYKQMFETSKYWDDIDWDTEDEFIDENDNNENNNVPKTRYNILEDLEFRDLLSQISVEKLRKSDSKYDEFIKLLKSGKKVIVFAFFKKSLAYLEERLRSEGISCVRIDGDVPSNPEDPDNDERLKRIHTFKSSKNCNVLLSSQVGSEGLDFQFCDTIVNWDLPWNPMVVEQRIGRIDRLGQKSERIHIINLVSSDTVEEKILIRLYQRINIFEESIGEIEPILGPTIRTITNDLLNPNLTEVEKLTKMERSIQAILREKQNMVQLEKESDNLLGLGDLIKVQIDKVLKLGRFITGKQLELYVNQFLETYCPESVLIDEDNKKADFNTEELRYLKLHTKIKNFLQINLSSREDDDVRFIHKLVKGTLKLAFYPNVANEYPEAELIHSRHPFVKCITEYYKKNLKDLPCTFRLRLKTDLFEPGNYFFVWSSIDEYGIFEGRFLKPFFINLETKQVIEDDEKSEQLLYHMVVNSEEYNDIEFEGDSATKLYDMAESYFMDFVSNFDKKRKLEAEAIVLRRKQSLKASHDVLKRRKMKAIDTIQYKGGSERVINMFNSQLDKLKSDYEIKLKEVESQKDVVVEFVLEGAGLLKIS